MVSFGKAYARADGNIHMLTSREGVVRLCCFEKTLGIAALTFGAGILLCTVLPSVALACVEAGAIIGVGFLVFVK